MTIRAALITVSDRRARGELPDATGEALHRLVTDELQAQVVIQEVIPDGVGAVRQAVMDCARQADVVVLAGGTGVGPRDMTPEAVEPVLTRRLVGFGECMRASGAQDPAVGTSAYLSRSFAGMMGRTLVLAVPGSPGGAATSVRAVLPLIRHAVALARGEVLDCGSPSES